MKNEQDLGEIAALLFNSENYRDFLDSYFKWSKKRNPRFSYAVFCKKGGFSSRSLPRDIMLGTKHVTLHSFPKLIRAIGLNGPLKIYFKLLVFRDEPKLNTQSIGNARIQKLMEKAKSRYLDPFDSTEHSPLGAASVLKREEWPIIYAALGTSAGSTIEEISSRSLLPIDSCKKILNEMVSAGIVGQEIKKNLYLPKNGHLLFKGLGEEEYFEKFFVSIVQNLMNKIETKAISNKNDLLFVSVTSLNKNKMPHFKEKLRELILNFIDDIEDPKGDAVGRVVVSLFT